HLTTGKVVAVKILRREDAADAARFLREAKIAAALSHRNIVQVFDFWEIDDGRRVFMVMELLAGETLGAMLERVGRLSVDAMRSILLPVVSALRAAHAQGVVHRDLKPDNVFLMRAPRSDSPDAFEVKVVDFGLAKATTASSQATAITETGSL